MTVDPAALKHMLNSPAYEKPDTLKHFLGDILGEGSYVGSAGLPWPDADVTALRSSLRGRW